MSKRYTYPDWLTVGATCMKCSRYGDTEVRVMALAEGYAMVRHKGCAPFAVSVSELREPVQ